MNEDLQKLSKEELERLYTKLKEDIFDLEMSDDMVCSSSSSNNAHYRYLRNRQSEVMNLLRPLRDSA